MNKVWRDRSNFDHIHLMLKPHLQYTKEDRYTRVTHSIENFKMLLSTDTVLCMDEYVQSIDFV